MWPAGGAAEPEERRRHGLINHVSCAVLDSVVPIRFDDSTKYLLLISAHASDSSALIHQAWPQSSSSAAICTLAATGVRLLLRLPWLPPLRATGTGDGAHPGGSPPAAPPSLPPASDGPFGVGCGCGSAAAFAGPRAASSSASSFCCVQRATWSGERSEAHVSEVRGARERTGVACGARQPEVLRAAHGFGGRARSVRDAPCRGGPRCPATAAARARRTSGSAACRRSRRRATAALTPAAAAPRLCPQALGRARAPHPRASSRPSPPRLRRRSARSPLHSRPALHPPQSRRSRRSRQIHQSCHPRLRRAHTLRLRLRPPPLCCARRRRRRGAGAAGRARGRTRRRPGCYSCRCSCRRCATRRAPRAFRGGGGRGRTGRSAGHGDVWGSGE